MTTRINTNNENIMNIKERIETIIDDYSFAKDENCKKYNKDYVQKLSNHLNP